MDYKNQLRLEVIPVSQLREEMVSKVFEDIAVIYKYVLKQTDEGRISAIVTKDMLKERGIPEEKFHEWAGNTVAVFNPPVLKPLTDIMMELTEGKYDEDDVGLYVATSSDGLFGAGAIFYPQFLDYVTYVLKENFYVIPSSVHEVIIAPVSLIGSEKDDIEMLRKMIVEVNCEEVRPEDVLSDNVFFYDGHTFRAL